ncbi:hypothetical protein Leryth_007690 [Lithospermum erythrorhizon]|nr:hypothetical protein Leryth_007690 [Lithospermum erythrorhizon]
MEELSGEATPEFPNSGCNNTGSRGGRRRKEVRTSMDTDDFINLLHGSDPVKLELNRLENVLRDKERELGEVLAENKALRLSERLREKAVEELTEELSKVDGKLKLTESVLDSKNLEIKKINEEKKASMAAQFAAEATLRRVHAAQKDDDMPPIEAILAPLEAELKLARQEEKYQLRLRVLEETLRSSSLGSRSTTDGRSSSNGLSRRQSLGGVESISKLTSNGFLPKRSPSFQIRSSASTTVLKHAKGTSKSFDGGSRSADRAKVLLSGTGPKFNSSQSFDGTKDEPKDNSWKDNRDEKPNELPAVDKEDTVPGLLYDMLQKEVIALRRAGHEKDQSLKDKDDAIEMLAKKVETLTKAMEVEAKKMRREVAAMEKEVAAMRVEKEHEIKARRFGNSKGPVTSSQMLPGRSVSRTGLTRGAQ